MKPSNEPGDRFTTKMKPLQKEKTWRVERTPTTPIGLREWFDNDDQTNYRESFVGKKTALREVTEEIVQTLGKMTINIRKLQTNCFGF